MSSWVGTLLVCQHSVLTMTEAVPACFALPLSCITARSRATLLCTAQGQAVRLCPLLFIAGRNAKHTNPVAIMTKSLITPSRVRRRDTIETAHQSRLSLPSAKDHTSEGGFVSGPTSGSDRFIPFRATSDQSGLEDQRSPPQTNLTKVTWGRKPFVLHGCQMSMVPD